MDQKNPEKQPEKEEQRNQKAPQPGSAGKKETGTSVAALFQDTGFWIRVINVIVIVVAILYYNQITGYHQQLVKAQKTIKSLSARLETAQSRAAGSADNAASGQDTGDASASGQTSDGKYKDGTYTGSAKGYGGPIRLTVTISDGTISNINVDDASGEDAAYYNNAVTMLDVMMQDQTWDVDTVSGATYSSNGLKQAVKQALGKAERK